MGARALFVTLLLAVSAVGCSSDDSPDAPTATVPSSTSTTAPADAAIAVDEVPDEITVEYVQAVMDALDASWGDMYRLYVESGGPTAETAAWLDALYDDDQAGRMDVALGEEAADGFDSTRTPPGDPSTRVRELLTLADGCIRARVDRDYDDVLGGSPTEDKTTDLVLRIGTSSAQNPTTWTIARELSGAIVMEDDLCAE